VNRRKLIRRTERARKIAERWRAWVRSLQNIYQVPNEMFFLHPDGIIQYPGGKTIVDLFEFDRS